MFVDTQSNEVTIRLDGLINYAQKGAEVTEESPTGSYTSIQQLVYPKIEFSKC